MREVSRRRTSCIAAPRRPRASLRSPSAAPRRPRASLRSPRAAPRVPSEAMREVSRRRSSCIAAPRRPRASPRVPSDAMREVSRRRTSCIAAPRRPRASPRFPSDAMREVSRRRTSCIGARGRTSAAIGAKPPPPISPSALRVRGCAALPSLDVTGREGCRALASRTACFRQPEGPAGGERQGHPASVARCSGSVPAYAGWPPGISPRGLPQIRTCGIPASGSSERGFATCRTGA